MTYISYVYCSYKYAVVIQFDSALLHRNTRNYIKIHKQPYIHICTHTRTHINTYIQAVIDQRHGQEIAFNVWDKDSGAGADDDLGE